MRAAGMRKRWDAVASATDATVEDLRRALGVHPLVARLLIGRGLSEPDVAHRFLHPKLADLDDPRAMPGCTAAAQRIAQAIDDDQPIVIYGDYDVDGVTASAILHHTLTALGARAACYLPHRLEEGYGLSTEALQAIARFGPCPQLKTPDGRLPLVVTVDCGITALEPAAAARDLGLDLIITDHHEFDPERLPIATAIVHPGVGEGGRRKAEGGRKEEAAGDTDTDGSDLPPSDLRLPSSPPSPLCGAGVAFKLAWQVARVRHGSDRLPERLRALMVDLVSLAAIATVADVVPLVGENRVLTAFGLGRIKQTRFVGLNAMIDAASLRDEKIDAYHVGFVLGPRLNACGRMGHARHAFRLLTVEDRDEAFELADFLTKENDRRRATERRIFDEAAAMVTDAGYDSEDCRAIVLGQENWHPGVVGIVASRLVERFGRPVVLLNVQNGSAQGSARSIDGFSIHAAFNACAEQLQKYGGHAMAAGLTLASSRIDAFREQLVAYANGQLTPADLVGRLRVDGEVGLQDCSLTLFDQLQQLAPFGRGNPSPKLLLRQVRLDRPAQRIGGQGKHLSVVLRDGQAAARAVGFGLGDLCDQLPGGSAVDLVFSPQVSTWQGVRRPEIHIADLAHCEPAAV